MEENNKLKQYFANVLASVICIIHIIIFCLIFIIPFTNSNYLLFSYILIVPFIEMHWIMNNDICCLTEAEKLLRGVKDNDCFTNKILSPIYKFPNNNESLSMISYFTINILICIVICKLINKYKTGEIREFNDLYVV